MTVSRVGDRTQSRTRWPPGRKRELFLFLLLAVVIWPVIAVGVVAGWGLIVWIYQLIAGPPGPV